MEAEKIKELIRKLDLQPLPVEGTLFKNTYKSTAETENGKPTGTCMMGMLCHEPLSLSRFHRLLHDETWHFYGGDAFSLFLLHPDGKAEEIIMGNDVWAGQHFQYLVPSGVWQAAKLLTGSRYALFGCTMSPGFTGDCFEGGKTSLLLQQFPEQSSWINELGVNEEETKMPEGFDC